MLSETMNVAQIFIIHHSAFIIGTTKHAYKH